MPLSATRRDCLARGGLLLAGAALAPRSIAQSRGVPEVVAASKPAVVGIGLFSRLAKPAFRFSGTGFLIDDGRIITCAHVTQIADPATREVLAVALPGGESSRIVEAKVVALRRDTDLAVLELAAPLPPSIAPLRLSNNRPPEGAEVVLMGFPIGSALGLHVASHRGIVAAIVPMAIPLPTTSGLEARNVQALRNAPIELLQLDATAYPGNSGGPVIEVSTGLVVGVVSMALVKGTRESAIGAPSGISYAVPVQQLTGMLPAK